MTKAELSLLVYFETCAVDGYGGVEAARMNAAEFEIAKRWNDEGFLVFGRISADSIKVPPGHGRTARTHYVRLSDTAWAAAHAERRERADRLWEKRPFSIPSRFLPKEQPSKGKKS